MPPLSCPIPVPVPVPVPVATAAQSIFGGAKPRDEKVYEEERKKRREAERADAERVVAEATSAFLKALKDGDFETANAVAGQINAIVKGQNIANVVKIPLNKNEVNLYVSITIPTSSTPTIFFSHPIITYFYLHSIYSQLSRQPRRRVTLR